MFYNELEKNKEVDLSHWPLSLKLIENELWSCHVDGIRVYDKELKLMRTLKGHGDHQFARSVVLLPDGTVAVAGAGRLYQSSKLG